MTTDIVVGMYVMFGMFIIIIAIYSEYLAEKEKCNKKKGKKKKIKIGNKPTKSDDYLINLMADMKSELKKLKVYRANIVYYPYVTYRQMVLNVDKSNFDEGLYYFDPVGGLVRENHSISIQETIRNTELSIKIYDTKRGTEYNEFLYRPKMYLKNLSPEREYMYRYAYAILKTFHNSDVSRSQNWYTKTGKIIKNY